MPATEEGRTIQSSIGRSLFTFGKRRMSMNKTALAFGCSMVAALAVWAASPIAAHPPAPGITASKAIELAAQFAGAATNAARYCSSVSLNEGGMTPAPHGSARHWVVTFQDAGADRGAVTRVYVDMGGEASAVVPPGSS
jgi:hypothetical protein